MQSNVYLSAGDIDLLLKIIEDWSYDVDLSISENEVVLENADDLYNYLLYLKREIVQADASDKLAG